MSYELHFMSYISGKGHMATLFDDYVDTTCIIVIIV